MKLIVIVPAFNEAKSIRGLLERMPDLKKWKINLQMVVVDDGSSDGTAAIAKKCGAVVLRHAQNEGLGKTIQDGIKYFLEQDADILVNIDADMQYNPEDINKLIQPILEGQADFVTAERFTESGGDKKRPDHMPWVKFWGKPDDDQIGKYTGWNQTGRCLQRFQGNEPRGGSAFEPDRALYLHPRDHH